MEEQRYSYRFYQHSTFSPAIHGHSLKFRMIPCENDCQHLEQQQMLTEPACSLLSAFDGMGNRLQYGFCQAPHAFFRIESRGVVTCRRYLLPDPQPSYLWRCASPLAAWDCAMQQ
ncbi:MAG: hypothetical protein KBT15_08455, partial [Bacteroidales bacterium]|nr:hypothetical protein [Candidatus Minthousia equi]